MTARIFISYSSRDALTATAICTALEEAGLACWIAPRNILPGQTWSEAIIDGINASQVMVLLYSAASNASPQVLREIERAVSKGLGLIAFRAEDVPLSKAMEYLISVSHWLDGTSGALETHLERLVESLQSLFSAQGTAAEPALPRILESPTPPSPALPRHNLPASLTSFVGRTREVADVHERLGSARLLTLLGTGGSGKTRLALQAASMLLLDYPDGVRWVEMAPLSDPDLVAQEVANVLNVKEQPGQSLIHTLIEALGNQKLLLVLDNCEHLLQGCTDLATRLLRACPNLTLLTTSRSALNAAGESTYRVPPLSFPESGKALAAAELERYEAVKLFVDRAILTQPAFVLTQGNAASVAAICFRLDGLPLALELAAARVRAMSTEQIAARLDARFKLLTGGNKSALPHHQTLRAMMDWSYALLTEQEKSLFARLSVFSGGWTLEAAEQVGIGEGIEDWEVLDLLFSLVDKSLVVYKEQGKSARYHLLETVREYAHEKLEAEGEADNVREKHQEFYLALAQEAEAQLTGPYQMRWLERLEEENDNLRAALGWCSSDPGRRDAGLRFCGRLQRFWWTRGYLVEGSRWCAVMLETEGEPEPTEARAGTLAAAGSLAWMQGDYPTARSYLEASLDIHRQMQNALGIAAALNGLGLIASEQGEYLTAQHHYQECLAIFQTLDSPQRCAIVLNNLARVAEALNDPDTAEAQYRESMEILRRCGDLAGIALALNNLASLATNRQELAMAQTYLEESLSLRRELGDRIGIAFTMSNLAANAASQGNIQLACEAYSESLMIRQEIGNRAGLAITLADLGELFANLAATRALSPEDTAENLRRAARLLASAQSIEQEIGMTPNPQERSNREESIRAAQQKLGKVEWDAIWAEGKHMTQEQAVTYALAQAGTKRKGIST